MTGLLDLEAIRTDHSVAKVAGAVVNLSRVCGEMRACCPFHDDKSPSFYIFADGRRWHCFGCGLTGDVLDFVQRYYSLGLRDAAERLCGGSLPVIDAPTLPTKPERDSGYALSLWRAASPIDGTPAETYLRRRGIVSALPPVLRFARLSPPKESGVLEANGDKRLPALVALVTDANDKPVGIQRTYLTEAGAKTSATDGKVKYSLGRVKGGAIRLGPVQASGLALCEGTEDALSLIEMGAGSAWAAAGCGMLPGMGLPNAVHSVVIGADADDAGRTAANRAAAAFGSTGREVRVIFPTSPFKDFNDEWQHACRETVA